MKLTGHLKPKDWRERECVSRKTRGSISSAKEYKEMKNKHKIDELDTDKRWKNHKSVR